MEGKTTGFASPAQGYEEQGIDLNRVLIHNASATYFGRLESGGMEKFGLPKGSLLVVDRSKDPALNSFVVIRHRGEFLCRLMTENNGRTVFTNGCEDINPVNDETEIIGSVTASIQTYDFSH